MSFDIQSVVMFLLAFTVAVTFHEFGHAFAAVALGDDGPKRAGRLTLNPIDHLDPLGTLILVVTAVEGLPFGWGKPVMTNPNLYKNPRTGDIIVSVAGPFMNLVLAVIFAVIIRTGYFGLPPISPFYALIDIALEVNIVLFLFNLIPIPPLDGSHILTDLLPYNMAKSYQSAMSRYGWFIFIAFILFAGNLIAPLVVNIRNLMVG